MKRFLFALLLIFLVIIIVAAGLAYKMLDKWVAHSLVRGSGRVVKVERPISGVNAVEVAGSWEAFIIQGDSELLSIEAEDNIAPLLTSTVTEGRLVLSSKPHLALQPTKPVRFYVTVKDLSAVTLSGSGAIHCDTIHTPSLTAAVNGSGRVDCAAETTSFTAECMGSGHIEFAATTQQAALAVHGSGSINGTLQTHTLTNTIEGSGWINLVGSAESQQITINGSGKYQGEAFRSALTKATVTGSGNIEVETTKTLRAFINGSGSIIYTGHPQVEKNIAGSGDVREK